MTARRHQPSELIIGVVGPYDLVERIMLSGAAARDEAFGAAPAPWPPRPEAAEAFADQGGPGPAGPASSGGPASPGASAWPREELRGMPIARASVLI